MVGDNMTAIMKLLPKQEMPRERLLKYGVENLSNVELLSLLLKTGTKEKPVQEVAMDILSSYQTISSLQSTTLTKLCDIKGVGMAKAMELLGAIELGKRIFLEQEEKKEFKFTKPEHIYKQFKHLFYHKKQEYFYCLYFNNKQQLIERKLLFMGTINQSLVHPREIFKEAYLSSASSIVCIHNHPSGDITPSREDIRLTKSLKEIGKIQGIPIVDHLIFTDDGYYSFYENNGLLN